MDDDDDDDDDDTFQIAMTCQRQGRFMESQRHTKSQTELLKE